MVVRTIPRWLFQGRGERDSPLLGGEGWVTVVKPILRRSASCPNSQRDARPNAVDDFKRMGLATRCGLATIRAPAGRGQMARRAVAQRRLMPDRKVWPGRWWPTAKTSTPQGVGEWRGNESIVYFPEGSPAAFKALQIS
jgi:hypothetical protein